MAALLALPALACGSVQDDERATAHNIFQGQDDLEAPQSNAVVHLFGDVGGCTGFLLTSTVAISAAHCDFVYNTSTIQIGVQNTSGTEGTTPPSLRAVRTITHVANLIDPELVHPFNASPTISQIARDVALVRFWPPVTMDASPRKPTFTRPSLTPHPTDDDLSFGSMHGGIAGYGVGCAGVGLCSDGGPGYLTQRWRQIAVRSSFDISHYDVGGGFAVWAFTADSDSSSGEPLAASGDSGGPLFRLVSPPDTAEKDVIGVYSWWFGPPDCGPFASSLCAAIFGQDENKNVYADITAPSTRAWIEEKMVQWGGEPIFQTWPGQVDYQRTDFGAPGCDVAATPSCDEGCLANVDRDCDLIHDGNDNCPDDYNPDQGNQDNDAWGDTCDRCRWDNGPDTNCNAEVEIVKWGPRPFLREDDVVGTPLAPFNAASPLQAQNWARYRGDRCDVHACMDVSVQTNVLPAATYGEPAPTDPCPQLIVPSSGSAACRYAANNELGRDGRVHPSLEPYLADTAYRFCRCTGAKNTALERVNGCMNSIAWQCPWEFNDFTSSTLAHAMTMDPVLQQIPNDPSGTTVFGTLNDAFTGNPKPWAAMRWDFRHDYTAISSTALSFPLTNATYQQVALDGLVWSSVCKLYGGNDPSLGGHFEPLDLRVHVQPIGGHGIPTHYNPYSCWGGDCYKTLIKPWVNIVNPITPGVPRVLLTTSETQVDITSKLDPGAEEWLALAAAEYPTVQLVSAAEPGWVIHAHGAAELPPTLAIVNTEALAFLGAIANRPEGGRLIPLETAQSACEPREPWDTTAWTLSARQRKLYLMKGGDGGQPELYAFDLTEESWSQIPLGEEITGRPLALTMSWRDGTLYALQLLDGEGAVALLRISESGPAVILDVAEVASPPERAFLSVDTEGRLVVSVDRGGTAYRLAHIEPTLSPPRLEKIHEGDGVLAAAPFADERMLNVAIGTELYEYQATALGELSNPENEPFQWLFD